MMSPGEPAMTTAAVLIATQEGEVAGDMAPPAVMPFRIANSLCGGSMEIACVDLMADAASSPCVPAASADLPIEGPESMGDKEVAVEEGGDVDELEIRLIPGSDDDYLYPVGLEQSCDGSSSVVSGGSSIIVSAMGDTLASGGDAKEMIVTPANGEGAEGSDLKIPSSIDLTVQSGGGGCALLADYIPLWGCISICGMRPEMEDSVVAAPWFYQIPLQLLNGDLDGINPSLSYLPAHFFGVYDGHGGAQVANYCQDRLHVALVEEIKNVTKGLEGTTRDCCQKQWERAFTNCFAKVDDEVGGKVNKSIAGRTTDASNDIIKPCLVVPSEPIAPDTVGSTAVVSVICYSHIIVANCGDSRAVLCRGKQPVPLSVDHKPDREDECTRIEAAGGKVINWNGYRVFGVLAMSRSIGDRYLKPWIIPEPEVTIIPRMGEDECLILASDGLWDVMSNEEVCDVARKRILLWHKKNGIVSTSPHRGQSADPAAQAAADYLSKLALRKGSKDNITVMVVDLKAQRKFKNRTLTQ